MEYFQIGDKVKTVKEVRAGMHEDGPRVCDRGILGTVLEIQKNEWDGIHVKLDSGQSWWFKPGQLKILDT